MILGTGKKWEEIGNSLGGFIFLTILYFILNDCDSGGQGASLRGVILRAGHQPFLRAAATQVLLSGRLMQYLSREILLT